MTHTTLRPNGPPPPSIRATPFTRTEDGMRVELLTDEERNSLERSATLVSIPRHTLIYEQGDAASYVYNVVEGVAANQAVTREGLRHVTSFAFPGDLLGLAENGEYVTTAQSISAVLAYKIPTAALTLLIRRDPVLDAAILCKLCHELRRSERHVIMNSRRDAQSRMASFLLWMTHRGHDHDPSALTIELPMQQKDIADYLGLSPEAVSRALHALETTGLIERTGRHLVRLADPAGVHRLADLA